MSDFMERAAAEADRQWPHTPHPETAMEQGFLAGAEWARDVLLAAHDREVAARAVRQAAEDRFYDRDRDRTLHGYYVLHDYAARIERGEDV